VTLRNTIVAVPLLGSVSVTPSTAAGGQARAGRIQLNDAAPLGGVTVLLQSSHAAVTVPPSVFVPAGIAAASFNVQTSPVGATITADVTATALGAAATTTITVVP